MRNRKLQNEKLDEMGRRLLKTASVREDEIESIVSVPNLFDGIKARIKAEKQLEVPVVSPARSAFSLWSWQGGAVAGVAFAGIVVLVLAVLGLSFYTKQPLNDQLAKEVVHPEKVTENKAIVPVSVSPVESRDAEDEDAPVFKHSTLMYRDTAKNKTAEKVNLKKQAHLRQENIHEPEGDFYPLTYTGNSEESAFGARVVRVELPRSSLFAMGVDLPLERGGSETVKADLLIGSDGVTRGFRFVK